MTRYWHAGRVALSTEGSWQDHLDRGSAGGEDFPLAVGTVAYAPADGMVRFRTSPSTEGGGQALTLVRADGVVFELFHARDGAQAGLALGGPSVWVREGQPVGHSGGGKGTPSQGKSTGPHMHEHAKANGRRFPISSFITGGGLAGTKPNPLEENSEMQIQITRALGREVWLLTDGAAVHQVDQDQVDRAKLAGASVAEANDPQLVRWLQLFRLEDFVGDLSVFDRAKNGPGARLLARWRQNMEAAPGGSVPVDLTVIQAAARAGAAEAVAAMKFPTKVTLPSGTLS